MEDGIGMDNMGHIVWQLALCLLLSWVIIFLVLLKGIQSLGKVTVKCSIMHAMDIGNSNSGFDKMVVVISICFAHKLHMFEKLSTVATI